MQRTAMVASFYGYKRKRACEERLDTVFFRIKTRILEAFEKGLQRLKEGFQSQGSSEFVRVRILNKVLEYEWIA